MSTDQSNPYLFRGLLCAIAVIGLILTVFLCLYIANRNKVFDAAVNGTVEDVKFFIERGVSVNAKNSNGSSLIHYATMNPNVEVLKFLVEKGADVNAKDNNGWTPLDFASGKKEMEDLLREVGAKYGKELRE